ncbi:MAG: M1 family metallopeptidase [Bacteroidota bacterium]
MKKGFIITCLLFCFSHLIMAQPERWQQHVQYKMNIDFDVKKHQFNGNQIIKYTNNSPDTLYRVFYHLYFNAFQPGSMMDVRSRTISDPDPRVGDRIFNLNQDEIGYHKISSLKQDGLPLIFEMVETILEVKLAKPILPGKSSTFEMVFSSQVPIQIRRSGRNNSEGIDYSMAQWYPKLCEYDYQGWHANPYIGREFYGVWGDFDVTLNIDASYMVGGTGYLQNADQIGKGYTKNEVTPKPDKNGKLSWHFIAPNVHDFLWAADPDYVHTSFQRPDGLTLNFYYQPNDKTKENWEALPAIMDKAFDYINKNFGKYDYKQYSFIQGGDGGMEYPMATLITGERNIGSLVGVAVHELMHSWYQMMLATNESLYAWMDEGFTSYASSRVMQHLLETKVLKQGRVAANPQAGNYAGYFNLAKSGFEEPLTTHSDHYQTNRAYGLAAYSKGAVFLGQLEYVLGKPAFDEALLKYFYTWKGKHPNVNDFIRVFEKTSNLELDWYKEYFYHTTYTVDYAINNVSTSTENKTIVQLERKGKVPMPVDVVITKKDGSKLGYTIPLQIMRGAKGADLDSINWNIAIDWPWTNTQYSLIIPLKSEEIISIEIDPSERMADIEKGNNSWNNPVHAK